MDGFKGYRPSCGACPGMTGVVEEGSALLMGFRAKP